MLFTILLYTEKTDPPLKNRRWSEQFVMEFTWRGPKLPKNWKNRKKIFRFQRILVFIPHHFILAGPWHKRVGADRDPRVTQQPTNPNDQGHLSPLVWERTGKGHCRGHEWRFSQFARFIVQRWPWRILDGRSDPRKSGQKLKTLKFGFIDYYTEMIFPVP